MSSLNFLEKGESANPKVIVIHGLMGSARNLYRLAKNVADAGFHVYAIDQRGHGHSPHGGEYTLEALAKDVFSFMDARSITTAHLIGHSLGARVSMRAASISDRVLSLTMLDAGTMQAEEGRDDVQSVVYALEDHYGSKAEAEQKLSVFPERTKQFLIANLRDRDGKLTWLFDLQGIKRELFESLRVDQSDRWQNVRCPSLVVRGDRSEYLTQAELERMKKLNPRAQTAVISNAGHWLHVDNPGDTSKVVIDFLNSVRSRS